MQTPTSGILYLCYRSFSHIISLARSLSILVWSDWNCNQSHSVVTCFYVDLSGLLHNNTQCLLHGHAFPWIEWNIYIKFHICFCICNGMIHTIHMFDILEKHPRRFWRADRYFNGMGVSKRNPGLLGLHIAIRLHSKLNFQTPTLP